MTTSITAPTSTTGALQINGTSVVTYDSTGILTGVNKAAVSQMPVQSSTTALSAQTVALFGSIPSWAKKIRVSVKDMSPTSATSPLLQIGPSGGIETSGYVGTCFGVSNTGNTVVAIANSSGFYLNNAGVAGNICSGFIELTLLDSATNTWVASGNVSQTGGGFTGGFAIAGHKPLAGVLTQVRLYIDGTNTFDGGSVSIIYE